MPQYDLDDFDLDDDFDWDSLADEESDQDVNHVVADVPPWVSRTGIFQPSFRQRLLDVSQNVEREWPKLRDDKALHLFSNLKRGMGTPLATRQQVLEDHLTIYNICLDYINQYPHKKEKIHERSVAKMFKRDIPTVISSLWHYQLKAFAPFRAGAASPNESLLVAMNKFICALFELYNHNSTYGSESYSELGLIELCLASPVIHISIHSLLFARSNECRRFAQKALEDSLSMEGSHGAGLGVDPYFKDLSEVLVKRQFQNVLTSATLADDCALYVISQILPSIVKRDFPFDLREVAWSRSITTLRCVTTEIPSNNMTYEATLLSIDLPNTILRLFFSKSRSSPFVLLEEVVTICDGFKLMSDAAILFAATFDYSKYESLPIEEVRKSFVKNNVQKRDRDYFYQLMFLLPVILEQMDKIKTWKPEHHTFISVLARLGGPVWEETLVELRALEEGPDNLEFHMIPAAIYGWSKLGTLIGIHRLVEHVMGCCSAECDDFLIPPNRVINRCSRCKKVWYCSKVCQKSDWGFHKPHCTTAGA